MAGATNRQMKAAGYRESAIKQVREAQGGRLSLLDAAKVAVRLGVPIRATLPKVTAERAAWVDKMATGLQRVGAMVRQQALRRPGAIQGRARERMGAAKAAFLRLNAASMRHEEAAYQASQRGNDAATTHHLARADILRDKAKEWRKIAKRHEARAK